MKKLLYVSAAFVMISCSKKNSDEVTLEGNWFLVATYADPGDGSGTFQPIESDKMVTFAANNTVTTNESFCSMGANSGGNSGVYNIDEAIIEIEDCEFETRIWVELNGNELILSYLCIEGCGEKYLKL